MVNEDEVFVRRLNLAVHCEIWENGNIAFWWKCVMSERATDAHNEERPSLSIHKHSHVSRLHTELSTVALFQHLSQHRNDSFGAIASNPLVNWEFATNSHNIWNIMITPWFYTFISLDIIKTCVCVRSIYPKLTIFKQKIIIITKPHNERTLAASSRSLFCSQ